MDDEVPHGDSVPFPGPLRRALRKRSIEGDYVLLMLLQRHEIPLAETNRDEFRNHGGGERRNSLPAGGQFRRHSGPDPQGLDMADYEDHVFCVWSISSMRQDPFLADRVSWLPMPRVGCLKSASFWSDPRAHRRTPSSALSGSIRRRSFSLWRVRCRRHQTLSIELIEGSAEALPLKDMSVDTVVTTWTLCTIPAARVALREMRRVLRPSGALLFVEHGRSQDESVRRWQDRLTPAWKRLAGGCHLNRPIQQLLEESGFGIERLETGYMRGPRPMTFMYEGTARPLRPGEPVMSSVRLD